MVDPAKLILDIDDLDVTYRSAAGSVSAVAGFGIHVNPGETVCIVGESGSGKSTSMLAALRLLPEGAEIRANVLRVVGHDMAVATEADLRKVRGPEVGFIFQDPMSSLNPVLSIGRQLTEALRFHKKISLAKARERAVELLIRVGISDPGRRLSAYPHELSGGMRQRVMIAIALACEPRLLIADEPTTALDVTIQAQILELIEEIKARTELSVVWITHDLGVVARLADRVLVMYAGRVVEHAKADAFFSSPQHPYTIALFKSLPERDSLSTQRLETIPGSPAREVVDNACAFAPRCSFATDVCRAERPNLAELAPGHSAACWVRPNLEAVQ